MRTIGSTFGKSAVPFAMTFFIVVIYAFIAASLMFFFERGTWSARYHTWVTEEGTANPFFSIIDWVFWVFYSILTVGYGQVRFSGALGSCSVQTVLAFALTLVILLFISYVSISLCM